MVVNPVKILIIDDNPGDIRLIQEMLAERAVGEFELESANKLSTGIKCLAHNNIGLVLLDIVLPDSKGYNTFKKVQAQAPEVPIVVLGEVDDEDLAIKIVQSGAQDYLVKDGINSYAETRVAIIAMMPLFLWCKSDICRVAIRTHWLTLPP